MRKTHVIAFGVTPVLLLLLCTVPSAAVAQQSAEPQQTEPQKTPAPSPRTVIPVAEVATQATEVSNLLHTLSAQFASSSAIATIHKVLPEVSETIALELAATISILQKQLWQRRQLQTTGWLNVLTGQATQLYNMLHHLADLHQTWTDTHAAAQLAQAPESILQQIDTTLATIAAAQTPLQTQRTAVLSLQSHVAQEVARCGSALAQIAQFQQQAVTKILGRDGLPIWSAALWADVRTALPERLSKVTAAYWADILHYARGAHAATRRALCGPGAGFWRGGRSSGGWRPAWRYRLPSWSSSTPTLRRCWSRCSSPQSPWHSYRSRYERYSRS